MSDGFQSARVRSVVLSDHLCEHRQNDHLYPDTLMSPLRSQVEHQC